METNERYIQVRGKLLTEKEYNMGDDIKVTVTVTDIQDRDLQDGTVDRTYKAKLFSEDEK